MRHIFTSAGLLLLSTAKLLCGIEGQLTLAGGNAREVPEAKENAEPGENINLIWSESSSEGLSKIKSWLELPVQDRADAIPKEALSRSEAEAAVRLLWNQIRQDSEEADLEALNAKSVQAAGKEMKYLERVFGENEVGERSLWISMHGGGGAPARLNDQQWRNQIRLYEPEEGIVVAPRAPTNNWNLWHEPHIDALFQRLIDCYVSHRGVSPNRVYLMGYSAGGDGVYQLAPRMADRFAAAAMMAGHPNDAKPDGLRNLPFMIFMGGNDGAYNRNTVAAQWGELLASLQDDDPEGYSHKVKIYEGVGHWMQGRDREALPWMLKHRRDPWPKKVVWRQSQRIHERFYWLQLSPESAVADQRIEAEVRGQAIDIRADAPLELTLRLSDALLDMDQPVRVYFNGEERFSGEVARSVEAIWQSLVERKDPASTATGYLKLSL